MAPSEAARRRAWYAHKQGLDGSLEGAEARTILERSGWARSVGGVGPYLTLFSRGGVSREAADADVAALNIHEIPAARNCTYVVPAADYALALTVGQDHWAGGDMRTASKLGVTDTEIDKLGEAVVAALGKSSLTPDQIRDRVGGAARSLGEEGKKKGVSTTLPLALGKLQAYGEIRRVPINGRLDQQRYKYVVWKPNPLAKFKLSQEEAAVELARRYFAWTGPASVAEFQWFSGLGVKACKVAMEPLKLVALVDGRSLLPEGRDAYEAFRVPKDPRYSLVSSIDAISLLRRDLKGLLDEADLSREFFGEKGSLAVGSLMDLPNHAIFDRGRLVGVWEFDTNENEIVWVPFIKKNKDLTAAVARTEAYVRDQLGDARSFSLDSPKSRVPKIDAMRKAMK